MGIKSQKTKDTNLTLLLMYATLYYKYICQARFKRQLSQNLVSINILNFAVMRLADVQTGVS